MSVVRSHTICVASFPGPYPVSCNTGKQGHPGTWSHVSDSLIVCEHTGVKNSKKSKVYQVTYMYYSYLVSGTNYHIYQVLNV